jgi:hypothetical protein
MTAGLRDLATRLAAGLRASSPSQRAVRTILALTAVLAFALEPDHGGTLAGVTAWLTLLAAPFAATIPATDAPLAVLLPATISWITGYGGHLPPVAPTLAMAATLYLHHTLAALAAATPSNAALDRSLLRRWTLPLLTGAAAITAAALLTYRTTQLPLSPVLQLAGLAGALATTALLVSLVRH